MRGFLFADTIQNMQQQAYSVLNFLDTITKRSEKNNSGSTRKAAMNLTFLPIITVGSSAAESLIVRLTGV